MKREETADRRKGDRRRIGKEAWHGSGKGWQRQGGTEKGKKTNDYY
jgi:hypothetical protein